MIVEYNKQKLDLAVGNQRDATAKDYLFGRLQRDLAPMLSHFGRIKDFASKNFNMTWPNFSLSGGEAYKAKKY